MPLVLVRTDAAIEILDMIQREEALPTHEGQERLDVTIQSMKKTGDLHKECMRITSSTSCKQTYPSNRNSLRIVLT